MTLAPGETEGVKGLCLDPHDLAIAKYVAAREKDRSFTRALALRAMVSRDRLLSLLEHTSVAPDVRERVHGAILRDFVGSAPEGDEARQR